MGEPGRGLPGSRDITTEQGHWFLSQEVQGDTSGEVKRPLFTRQDSGADREPHSGGTVHSCRGTAEATGTAE